MQEEKNRIERVLGAISAPELIQRVLAFALSVSPSPSRRPAGRAAMCVWLCFLFGLRGSSQFAVIFQFSCALAR